MWHEEARDECHFEMTSYVQFWKQNPGIVADAFKAWVDKKISAPTLAEINVTQPSSVVQIYCTTVQG